MRNVYLLILILSLAGCSSAPVRTKYNDKVMTVMIDPEGLSVGQYNELIASLSETGRFKILDRGMGYAALKTEQDRQYVTDKDRFEARQRLAHYGKMHGAGGVISASESCQETQGWGGWYKKCRQQITIIDTSTTQVISSVTNSVDDSNTNLPTDWTETVAKFEDSFPKDFDQKKDEDRLENDRKIAEVISVTQKENGNE